MKPGEGEQVANEEIGPHTGDRYEHRELASAAERREILPDIERAVDEGRRMARWWEAVAAILAMRRTTGEGLRTLRTPPPRR